MLGRLAVVVAIAVVLGACSGQAAPTITTQAPASTGPTTSTSSLATTLPPTTSTTKAPGLQDITACQIPERSWVGVGLGFPRSSDRLPSTGTVDVVVLFVDFDDAPAVESAQAVFDIISPAAEEFLAGVSYGRFGVNLRPYLDWLRLGDPSPSYGEAIRTFEAHRDFVQEAIDLADSSVDFSGVANVVVVATPNATAVGYGPTWLGGDFPGGRLTPDGAVITNAITSGADLTYWRGLWLPHEMGHSLSLADLYSYDGLPGFTGDFSLMNDIGGAAPEYLAYERWLLGWLDDDQVLCLASDWLGLVSPIETAGGTKALMVPVTPTRVVVVESRRPFGYDKALSRPGAIVYRVDTSIASGYGPIEVLNGQQALLPGESITVDGVTVEVIDASDSGDTIWVTLGG